MYLFIAVTMFLLGNFAYQYLLGKQDYAIAFERAYFQVIAIIFVLVYQKLLA